ncbi:MAG: preprotein translocase subunit SecE [Candidatus Saccharibacteria bacterium]|nr:preprotein translocase subunit SecE [Candidatus Saccharibacteria bacterium]
MAKITRIKASDGPRDDKPADHIDEPPITREKVVIKDKKTEKSAKAAKKAEKKKEREVKNADSKKVFVLFRPFVALGRYLRDSWREIRQVRWPNRKATWKMVLAVIIYTALFVAIISLLDIFFTWLFSLIIK